MESEHEEIATLMMEALDGELDQAGKIQMEAHLLECSPCARQWQAIQVVHTVFLDAPAVSPAAGFAQRTLSRLPNTAYRLWMGTLVYGMLLVAGLLPVAFVVWLALYIGPAFNEPAFVRSLLQASGELYNLGTVLLGTGWQAIGSTGDLLREQPVIIGWLMVMLGAIFLWGGVYRQLTSPQRA